VEVPGVTAERPVFITSDNAYYVNFSIRLDPKAESAPVEIVGFVCDQETPFPGTNRSATELMQ
jgi:hypothetical protein